jgi:hypothetical protein
MKLKCNLLVLVLLAVLQQAHSQNVGINGTGAAPDNSAMLDIVSSSKGLLIPRVALTAANAAGPITSPATSLLIYNTATAGTAPNIVTPGYYYNSGTTGAPSWVKFYATNAKAWETVGNALAGTEFFGSTNAQAVKFYCNNIERMRINPTDGEIVAGATASPYAGDEMSAVATAALPFALNGYSAQNGSGTWGEILAASTTGFSAVQGVYGGSGVGAGVLGNYNGSNTSNVRAGVSGICSTPAATAAGAGVYGYNAIATGNQHMGVLGLYNATAFGIGVYGIADGGGIVTGNIDAAVVGWRANNANYSGYFNGNHTIANGTKAASVPTTSGNQLLYCMESPEVWFEDIGSGTLKNGTATINLDPLFLETVVIDDTHPMHVFVQMEGESNEVYVVKDKTSFKVKERSNGNSNVDFSYRIMAKRVHFQDHRFGNDPVWGPGDTRKYSQYATPPPVDYDANVKFQLEQKQNRKQTPMPEGFIYYDQIQKEANERALTKEHK